MTERNNENVVPSRPATWPPEGYMVPVAPATFEASFAGVDPYRVEIKETAKGDPQISVRATADGPATACRIAVEMYRMTRDSLGLDTSQIPASKVPVPDGPA